MAQQLPRPPIANPSWAWFLDVDGTLIHIAPTPSAISVPQELPGLLDRLSQRFGGALALVSGRTLDNLRQLVAPFDPPAAGQHGLECKDGQGRVARMAPPPGLEDIRHRLGRLAEEQGLLLEDKGLAVALHYRQAPEREAEARRLVESIVAVHPEFVLTAGKMVFEVKPKGADKGSAVRTFMTQPPFAGRLPVFVGDDMTDEDGFRAANALGGLSVLVGPLRESAAMYRLHGIHEAQAWLAAAAGVVWPPRSGEGGD